MTSKSSCSPDPVQDLSPTQSTKPLKFQSLADESFSKLLFRAMKTFPALDWNAVSVCMLIIMLTGPPSPGL